MAKKSASKKKQSSGLLAKLNLNNPKNRIIATVVVFAIVGGGIFVFKSFAATASWVYNRSNNNLGAVDQGPGAPCRATVATDSGGKNPISVVNLACSRDGQAAIATTQGSYLSGTLIKKSYRICVTAKVAGQITATLSGQAVTGTSSTQATFTPGSGSYTYNCTLAVIPWRDGPVVGTASATKAGTFINVSAITLEQLPDNYGSTTSVSTPAPSK